MKINFYENQHENKNIQNKHSHSNYQILFIVEGNGNIIIDEKKFEIASNNLIYLASHVTHQIISHEKMTVLCLDFNLTGENVFLENVLKDDTFISSFILKKNLLNSSMIVLNLKVMLNMINQEVIYYQEKITIYLAQILFDLIKLRKLPQFNNANDLRAYQLKDYINNHYYEINRLDHLENIFSLSLRRLEQLFKDTYGETLNQYLNRVRIDKSQELLATTHYEVVTICFEVGYASLATFYRQFKQQTNQTPYQYRKVISENENNF